MEPTTAFRSAVGKEIARIVRNAKLDEKYPTPANVVRYEDFFSNKMLMILVIQEGVTYKLFDLIRDFTPFSEAEWAQLLDISGKSLQRYRQGQKSFKRIQSEKIVEVAEVTKVGLDVFGEMEKLKLWLETPNFSLGNLKPKELLGDSYGKDLIISELTRINYGILV